MVARFFGIFWFVFLVGCGGGAPAMNPPDESPNGAPPAANPPDMLTPECDGVSERSSFAPRELHLRRFAAAFALDAATRGADATKARSVFYRAVDIAGGNYLADLRRRGVVKRGAFSFSPRGANLELIGALSETETAAQSWHLRVQKYQQGEEGNFGFVARRDFGGALGGVNIFWDYESPGDFLRAGVGGELQSRHALLNANLYAPLTETEDEYSAGGYDAALKIRAPHYPNISAVLEHSRFFGRGREDETMLRAGLRLSPARPPIWMELQYSAFGGEFWRAAFGGHWNIGKRESVPSAANFIARDHFYESPRREYSQRIRRKSAAAEDDFFVAEVADGERPPDAMNGGNAGKWREIFAAHSAWIVREWWGDNFSGAENSEEFVQFPNPNNQRERQASFYAFSVAAALLTGAYDADKETAQKVAAQIVRSLAACHVANDACSGAHSWGGDSFTVANFEAHAVAAAWMIHRHLRPTDRLNVARMAEYAADRVMARAPQYADDVLVDTAAESNGWNAWILEVAANMYPRHSRAAARRTSAENYRRAALAAPADCEAGINLTGEYAAGNHGAYPHPSYTAGAARQPLIGMLYYRLGGGEPPAVNMRNVPQIYKMLSETKWRRVNGVLAKTGGGGETIYRADGRIFWPHNKSPLRAEHYWVYAMLDSALALEGHPNAMRWETLHLEKLQELQQADGRIRGGEWRQKSGQYNQGRDVAAAYLSYFLKHNGR